jgi:hypothetical protein
MSSGETDLLSENASITSWYSNAFTLDDNEIDVVLFHYRPPGKKAPTTAVNHRVPPSTTEQTTLKPLAPSTTKRLVRHRRHRKDPPLEGSNPS